MFIQSVEIGTDNPICVSYVGKTSFKRMERQGQAMKCVILAGGTGDRLWPLSRKHYPKQFMEVRDGRSLLQETIVRNMPFCEEFIIVTGADYEFIVEGQMRAFQGLRYRCVYEESPHNTAAAVAFVAQMSNPSELLYVVAADTIIDGAGYRDCVLRAMTLAREGYITLFGVEAKCADVRYGYVKRDGETVLCFREKPSQGLAVEYVKEGGYVWNSGSMLMCAGDFWHELKVCRPTLYGMVKDAAAVTDVSRENVWLENDIWQNVPSMSVEKAVLELSDRLRIVDADYEWVDVDELADVIPHLSEKKHGGVIQNGCHNVDIVNRTNRQLVVANGLCDITLINTEDAIYVASRATRPESIRSIIEDNQEEYGHYFERNRRAYRHWGCYEVLSQDKGFKVKRVTIEPGQTIYSHVHDLRSEHWAIVSGRARITLAGEMREYRTNESVYVPKGVEHEVSNPGDAPLIIIETGIGEQIAESDMVRTKTAMDNPVRLKADSITRLEPAFKDYLWGGNRLKTEYGKKCDYEIVAESWEMSAHPAGQSIVGTGHFRGMRFGDYIRRIGKECLGWKCQAYEEFPVLVKLIDARENLSVQVHPDDAFAMEQEREYGKNEMWHILECEEGAHLYCGFCRDVTRAEVMKALEDGTILDLLNEVQVHPGDTIFIPAGTVHAIGAGIVLCEIQQNSNSTYRVYDYGRKDKYGNERELHIEKAMQVMQFSYSQNANICSDEEQNGKGYTKRLLGQCKYFECTKVEVTGEAELVLEDSSFTAVVILDGMGMLCVSDTELAFRRGDTFFIPARETGLQIYGSAELLLVHV